MIQKNKDGDIWSSYEGVLRRTLTLFSIIAPALFYLRPSLGSYLLHLTTMEGGNVIFCMEQN